MKRLSIHVIALLALACLSGTAWSKGAITKIVIEGRGFSESVEITDYLPSPAHDDFGRSNTYHIYREVEGNWFRATEEWDDTVRPFLRA